MAQSGPDLPSISLARERERAIELISAHFAHDNLTLDELERRIEEVYRAPSLEAIQAITRDLQRQPAAVAPASPERLPEVFAPGEERLVSIMGDTKRRGIWQPPRRLRVWSVMSETLLDLTEALLSPGVSEIHLFGLMTSVKIVVPPGVRVVLQPGAFMAEVSDEALAPPPVGSGAPVIRVTGFVMMAELKVLVRRTELPSEETD